MTTTASHTTTAEYKWSQKVEGNNGCETCPVCRSQMREMLRAEENHSVFIWFECTKERCAGRKLKQFSRA